MTWAVLGIFLVLAPLPYLSSQALSFFNFGSRSASRSGGAKPGVFPTCLWVSQIFWTFPDHDHKEWHQPEPPEFNFLEIWKIFLRHLSRPDNFNSYGRVPASGFNFGNIKLIFVIKASKQCQINYFFRIFMPIADKHAFRRRRTRWRWAWRRQL